jgi:hypothetical protein
MRKTNIAIMFIIVIALVGALSLYGDRLNLTKPALKVTVITGNNPNPNLDKDFIQITNMTFEQTTVPIYYKGVDSPVEFPDIDIEGKNSSIMSIPVTYWQSQKREKIEGSYTFILTFREPYVPKKGDLLILDVRMNDFMGVLEFKTTAFYVWK